MIGNGQDLGPFDVSLKFDETFLESQGFSLGRRVIAFGRLEYPRPVGDYTLNVNYGVIKVRCPSTWFWYVRELCGDRGDKLGDCLSFVKGTA